VGGRYDDARTVLRQVPAPGYTHARVALMNVEYWSGNASEALAQAGLILARHPGNVTAPRGSRLEAAARPWWAKTEYTLDAFDDGREPWHEVALSLTRRTPVGPIVVRGSHAARFGDQDELVEVEFYPRFRPGTHAYLSVGGSPSPTLYPRVRLPC